MKSVLLLAACLLFVSSNGLRYWKPLPGPGFLHSLTGARLHPSRVSEGPLEYGRRSQSLDDPLNSHSLPWTFVGSMGYGRGMGQGCVQSEVADMNCAHGTYVDRCNVCQCAKGPNEICGGACGQYGRCSIGLFCFTEDESHRAGRCISHVSG
ncbi:uncharacterized protein LOC122242985 isoform X3 [Penaeus japonicus]|uniref:uncharacterized protein LOC122242985 isoform X3 n=1 Tax=Penaeus japonicus TaxID=27405 RepID=UPI001C70E134|nr:uncharacterized protein LOC122242985 isoform X3 [Penaeus japonicus]